MGLENLLIVIIFVFEAAFAIYYWISWNRLKITYKKLDTPWVFPANKTLQNDFLGSPTKAVLQVISGMITTIKIIFFMTAKNSDQRRALASIRLSLIGFIATPIIIMLIFATYATSQV